MSFGSKIKQYRTTHNMSQEELADILGTTKQVISRYENEQRSPKISIAVEIAKKLNIPIETLIDDNKSLDFGFTLSEHEKAVITAYRERTDLQQGIDSLLGIYDNEYIANDMVNCCKKALNIQKEVIKQK